MKCVCRKITGALQYIVAPAYPSHRHALSLAVGHNHTAIRAIGREVLAVEIGEDEVGAVFVDGGADRARNGNLSTSRRARDRDRRLVAADIYRIFEEQVERDAGSRLDGSQLIVGLVAWPKAGVAQSATARARPGNEVVEIKAWEPNAGCRRWQDLDRIIVVPPPNGLG